MVLVLDAGDVEIDQQATTYAGTPDSSTGRIYWSLDGATTFTKGMPGKGIGQGKHTKWDDVADPYGPDDPLNDDINWDDQVWLAERAKAKANPTNSSSRFIELTDGHLSIHAPASLYGRLGRWVFKDKTGKIRKKALTDRLTLSGRTATDAIWIETKGGRIAFKPSGNGKYLAMDIRHKLDLDQMPIKPGDPLQHFAMLADFADGETCDTADVPYFERRSDVTGSPTPGDLCPPRMFDA
jgi:hypothetical protein